MNISEPLFTGNNVIYMDEVNSTNTYAMELLSKTNPPEGTCIYSAYQSAGRGQIGRFWHSSKGENLLISYIFYPKQLKIKDQFNLNIISALAVRDVVSHYCNNVKIKWPNDVYVNDQKMAGILVQNILNNSGIKASVVGIGLNVNEIDFPNTIPNPISLRQFTLTTHNLADIRHLLSSKLEFYYIKMKAGQYEWLKVEYTKSLYRLNQSATFTEREGNIFNGAIQGVDDNGKLLIINEMREIKTYDFREINYVI